MITNQDAREFAAYLATLTDIQLFNVLELEAKSSRDAEYVRLCLREIKTRRKR